MGAYNAKSAQTCTRGRARSPSRSHKITAYAVAMARLMRSESKYARSRPKWPSAATWHLIEAADGRSSHQARTDLQEARGPGQTILLRYASG